MKFGFGIFLAQDFASFQIEDQIGANAVLWLTRIATVFEIPRLHRRNQNNQDQEDKGGNILLHMKIVPRFALNVD